MSNRKVEVFTAGCPLCEDAVRMVRELVCECCDLEIIDLNKGCRSCLNRASAYGIHHVPAVVVNGKLVGGSVQQPITREALVAAGIGQC
jgi:glutaredoxin